MNDGHIPGSSFGLFGVFLAAWVMASAFWLSMGATIFKMFIEPQIKKLRLDLAEQKIECAEDTAGLKNRIVQLETVMLMKNGAELSEFGAWKLGENMKQVKEIDNDAE